LLKENSELNMRTVRQHTNKNNNNKREQRQNCTLMMRKQS